jgi:hypothetical protein
MNKLRVYVAGAYTSPDAIQLWANQRIGIRTAVEVLLAGMVPFCPFIDSTFFLMLREGETITVEQIYAYSLAWLEVSDCVLVIPGWKNSKGTIAEIARAKELKIPVFYSFDELLQWKEVKESLY